MSTATTRATYSFSSYSHPSNFPSRRQNIPTLLIFPLHYTLPSPLLVYSLTSTTIVFTAHHKHESVPGSRLDPTTTNKRRAHSFDSPSIWF